MTSKTVSQWLQFWEIPEQHQSLRSIYGTNTVVLQERATVARRVLYAFGERFGDIPVRLFRAPGRVNLRGMHVDTHGGFLNLMTHQREVLLAAAPTGTKESVLANVNPAFTEVTFDFEDECRGIKYDRTWWEGIADPSVSGRPQKRSAAPATAWSNYCIGAVLRIAHGHRQPYLGGLNIMVDSDLPRGAALSSSAALIVASLLAYECCNALESSTAQLIQATQDVEWYAGARVGMSDQTAILMGRPGQMLHLAVFAQDFSIDGARYIPFPQSLDLLVVNSHTRRTLSGEQRLDYAKNRFAYSMALVVLQRELRKSGWSEEAAAAMDRLSRITPDAVGGVSEMYRLLQRIPLSIDIESLKQRYQPPGLDSEYERYFGDLEKHLQPKTIPLRGPLLFGIAESERARLFPEMLVAGDYELAGQLMTVGHNGDRVRKPDGAPFSTNISDAKLQTLAEQEALITDQPGVYGASSPALDMLADTAMQAGALGACLTGAGIAGAMLVLCDKEDTDVVRHALTKTLQTELYGQCALLATPLDADTATRAVVVNHPTAGAGEVLPED
jgi:galactokinase